MLCISQAIVVASAPPSVAAPADFDHAALASNALNRFIRPAYARLATAATTLEKAATTLCETPSPTALDATRTAFRGAVVAWGRIEIMRFGPIIEDNRFERIFFWPDRKGIGERQIRRLLANRRAAALSPDKLAQKSVALQGLTALEQVLYGAEADELSKPPAQSFRCSYVRAVSANLVQLTTQVREAWASDSGFAKTWLEPGNTNSVYLSGRETTLELVKALDHGLEFVRDERLAPAIGMGPTRRVMRPILWRSKLSMTLIHANIAGLNDLLFKAGLAEATRASARDGEGKQIDGALSSIGSEFALTLQMSGALAREADPFARPDIRRRLIPVGYPLRNIRANAVGLIKAAAGLSIGFNASDGD